jgi:hypothetical protein
MHVPFILSEFIKRLPTPKKGLRKWQGFLQQKNKDLEANSLRCHNKMKIINTQKITNIPLNYKDNLQD